MQAVDRGRGSGRNVPQDEVLKPLPLHRVVGFMGESNSYASADKVTRVDRFCVHNPALLSSDQEQIVV